MMRKTVLGIAVLVCCLILTGFLGGIHRGADSIAILRPMLAVICFVGLFLTCSIWKRLLFGGMILLTTFTVGAHFTPQQTDTNIRFYSKNLGHKNVEMQKIVADIQPADVDVVMLQEVTLQNEHILKDLQNEFPFTHLCRFSGRIGIAVMSRHTFAGDPMCSDLRAVSAAPILLDGKHLWVVFVHIPWPWPFDTAKNENAAVNTLSNLKGMVVIAGDFNMVPWSGRVGRIASMTGTTLTGPVLSTLFLGEIPLPIDLAMAPGGGTIATRPQFGSQHFGIIADLTVWPP
ncbi:MAG: endonuclease/exonuclease/phosphatase family protein [Roseobacter sp.]